VFPVDYPDAVRYNGENYPGAIWIGPGYVSDHAANSLPNPVVIRPVKNAAQYLWDGKQLHLIPDPPTSSCLLYKLGEPGAATLPADWVSTLAVGSPVSPCSLPDGLIFAEVGSGQQHISWRGAALPVSYPDAVKYNADNNHSWAVVAPGYVAEHPAVLPVNTVLRPVGQAAQYLWDGSQLHLITDPGMSDCLVYVHPQNGLAVVPFDWASTLKISASHASCSLPDNTVFGQNGSGQQYITWQGVTYPLDYSDAVKYNTAGHPGAIWISPGYTNDHPYGVLPPNTVVRPVGATALYYWTGAQLQLITTSAVSSCVIAKYKIQSAVDVLPADWLSSLATSGTKSSC
jgi:hypothetical protein